MKKMCALCAVVCAGVGLVAGARADVVAKVDFAKEAGVVRPALHSSGWSPRVYPRTISNDKPYHALVAFGSLITDCPKLYSAESSEGSAAFLVTFGEDVNR